MDERIVLHLPRDLSSALDEWLQRHVPRLDRAEGARRLLELGLKSEGAQVEGRLDEALEESFPASDPPQIGRSEHAGEPRAPKR